MLNTTVSRSTQNEFARTASASNIGYAPERYETIISKIKSEPLWPVLAQREHSGISCREVESNEDFKPPTPSFPMLPHTTPQSTTQWRIDF